MLKRQRKSTLNIVQGLTHFIRSHLPYTYNNICFFFNIYICLYIVDFLVVCIYRVETLITITITHIQTNVYDKLLKRRRDVRGRGRGAKVAGRLARWAEV